MKSEHRHELKTNELAEWIANFPQWAQENLNTIIYAAACIMLVAVIYFYYGWYNNRTINLERQTFTGLMSSISQSKAGILQAQSQGYDSSSLLFNPARDLRTIADKTKNNQMGALAQIKAADALRMELHYRLGSASPQEAAGQINDAKAAYTAAITKAAGNKVLTAQAKFGLGLCEEELGNFEQAKQIYAEIVSNAEYKSTVAAVQAKQRLKTMDDYKQQVVFKALPAPAQAQAVPLGPMAEPSMGSIIPAVHSPNNTGAKAPNQ
jgi:tetratricopeptide (TPR) repeat protein